MRIAGYCPLPLQALAEHEAYLQQLESEGRAEEVYGRGVQLVTPRAALVLKTRAAGGGPKVFINICTSDKVGLRALIRGCGSAPASSMVVMPPAGQPAAAQEHCERASVHAWCIPAHPARWPARKRATPARLPHTLILARINTPH